MFDENVIAGPPTPESAAIVLTVDASALPRRQALALVEAAQRLARAAEAVQAAAMVAASGPDPGPDGETDLDGEPVDEAAEEVAVALGNNRHFGLRRVDLARYLRRWLPRTAAAMRAGSGFYEAGLVKAAAAGLSDPTLISRLEAMVIGKGTRDLARRLRRAAARLDTEGQAKKAEKRRTERRLEWWKDRHGDGEYGLVGSGPTHLVALLAAAVDAEAKPKLPGDCRSIAMRRFDVLIDWARKRLGLPCEDPLGVGSANRPASPVGTAAGAEAGSVAAEALAHAMGGTAGSGTTGGGGPTDGRTESHTGRCDSCGRSRTARVPIQVTVPLGTVLGLESTPGEVTGWGLLDAEACRELAADGAWRRWLTDPATGELLDVGAREYVPSAALARFVRGRDRSCRWPGCAMPAVRCDLDHREPFDHAAAPEGRDQPGPTVRDNLDPLCRRHHRIKTATAWVSTRQAAGPSVWTSPCGRHYTQPNEPVVDATLDVEAPAQLEEADLRRSPQPKARQKVEVKERVPAMSAAGPVGSWNEMDDLPDSYRGDPPF